MDRSVPLSPGVVAHSVRVTNVDGHYFDHSVIHYNTTNHISTVPTKDYQSDLRELEKYISKGAAHNSRERDSPDTPKCHPETREAVQEDIMSWIGYGDEDQKPTQTMLWLSGPAGAGKTAIAGSIADTCHARGWLAGGFFFSSVTGGPDRRSKRCVIPTLAYHLLHQKSIPGIREGILSAIADNPSVFDTTPEEQLNTLILGPLRGIPHNVDRKLWPKVIIIDGLDECDGDLDSAAGNEHRRSREENHRQIISLLSRSCSDPAFPFRVIVVSRPEPAIRDAIVTSPGPVLQLFLDEKYKPDADVRLFLEAKFSEIRRRLNLPGNWPSEGDIQTLVEQASGQFVYPATVLRFIQDGKAPPPEQLRQVIQWKAHGTAEPLAALDTLYLGIIRTSIDPPLAMKWLFAVSLLRKKIWDMWEIFGLLESSPGEAGHLLGALTSLIDFGPDEDGLPLFHFYHKSFYDLLNDERRSRPFHALLHSAELTENTQGIIQSFLEDRFYAVVRNRGAQGTLVRSLPDGSDPTTEFRNIIPTQISWAVTGRHRYEDSDVDWLWPHIPAGELQNIYWRVHKDCPWYACLDGCRVWRKGIAQRCMVSWGKSPWSKLLHWCRYSGTKIESEVIYRPGDDIPDYPTIKPKS